MASKDSYVFTLRIWHELGDDGQVEWCGRVQRLPQGPIHYFRSWSLLIDHLLMMLSDDTKESRDETDLADTQNKSN